MAHVKHMKWWGWGEEGVHFEYANKPAFAPFVKNALDVDLRPRQRDTIDFSTVSVPASRAGEPLLEALAAITGAEHLTLDDELRIVHWAGKSVTELLLTRAGDFARVPDVVVYPGTEEEVAQVLRLAVERDLVVIPFGGGTSISRSLQPDPHEERTIVSLDLGRMNQVLSLDETSGLATIQAGVLGPDMEEQLNARGWTLGHFPDSFTHSTLGGWAATRSSGMQSDKYGDIADIVRGLRVVRPGGTVVLRPLPSTSTGPSLREMMIGSEGRLGVITQLDVHVHRIAEHREVIAYMFPTWQQALVAMREIARSGISTTFARVSDAHETAFSLSTQKAPATLKKKVTAKGQDVLWELMRRRGWDTDAMCIAYVCFEGAKPEVERRKKAVAGIVKKQGALVLGAGPGALYDQKKFDTPYLRDFLLEQNTIGDVSETAAPWSKLTTVHQAVYDAAHRAFEAQGKTGWIMSHMSHSYHAGACLYFTFGYEIGEDPHAEYAVIKSAIQQAFIDAGATLSHHHGVGLEHSPWMEQDVSPEGVQLLRSLFAAADPGGNFNPGKIVG
ncbi:MULTISPECIES: FAD-binding oxidoreductase [Kocuria]|jgi:alkyldihydroxyacetonephosphate synthase|uniref:Dehydrogenase n=1 Tax=Kocuria rosea subsp. polaris TaxID=136273 RepID=A0A0A6VRC6_KOCRO|nr:MULTISPECIES: FAD-binding oxidoreductase [Kocuria]MCC5783988.1 FAD-binding oxidoreductase [Kocuria sp. CCUG 69068]KHD96294.1 dehydrogenase [Kocuria polaris]PWF85541.1 FAD-binding oxidoreductase [Kocuria rosea]PWF88945.1 FAD-binding oxidoreductase [Kocuria rosea]QCY33831.1 FAD-binding oxidoreductase [Kocuria rosea]